MNTAPKQRTYEETVDNLQPLTVDLGVVDGDFYVKRTGGMEKGGWYVAGMKNGDVVIKRYEPENGQELVKAISPENLIRWQEQKDEKSYDPAVDVESSADPATQTAEQSIDTTEQVEDTYTARFRELFAPVISKKAPEVDSAVIYDNIFNKDYDMEAEGHKYLKEVQDSQSTPKGREDLKIQNIDAAVGRLPDVLRNIPELLDIIKRHENPDSSLVDVVSLLRTNANLRLEAGKLFIDKINDLAKINKLPSRVTENKQKNPNHYGYEGEIRSREYVAVLCLSMLDGTYDDASTKGDPITILEETGKVSLGMHRAAAEIVLFGNIVSEIEVQ